MDKNYICDTNVLISSIFSKNTPPSLTVDFIQENGFFAFSHETFSELSEVINREKFDKFSPREKRKEFLETIRNISNLYEIIRKVEICRDPKDDKFLDVAIASYADYLITGDEDLLVLKSIGDTAIITPRAFIEKARNL